MAGSTLTITVVSSTSNSTPQTVTLTLPTQDWPDAKTSIQNISKNGGFFDDLGNFYPASAILKVVIS